MICNWKKINNTRIRNINPETIRQHNTNNTKFYEWIGTEVEKKPYILSFSVGDLFVDINYTTFYDREELLEVIFR